MKKLGNCIRAELIKLFERRKYKIIIMLPAVYCLIVGAYSIAIKTRFQIGVTNIPLSVLSVCNNVIMPLMALLLAADLFAGEQEGKTIKSLLTRPVSRSCIYFGKIVSIMIYLIISYGMTLFVALIMSAFSGNFTAFGLGTCFASYILSILPMFAVVIVTGFLSQIARSPSVTIILGVLASAAMGLIGTLLPQFYGMMLTSHTGFYKLFMGSTFSMYTIMTSLGMLLGYGLVFYVVGDVLFNRRDY
ncbi:MAG: ABC transporter permease [Clostridia bacterium]|nr:ABC transporter permease [Clostridia bacterium]